MSSLPTIDPITIPHATSAISLALTSLLGPRFSEVETVRLAHAVDESYHSWSEGVKLPDGVVFPGTAVHVLVTMIH